VTSFGRLAGQAITQALAAYKGRVMRPLRKLGCAIVVRALVTSVLLAGCTQQSASLTRPDAGAPDAGRSTRPSGTLRIAWPTEPEVLNAKLGAGGGVNEFYWVFNSYLTYRDFGGVPHPMIAQELPSQERGDWIVNSDGTMVTTYRLQPGVRWHDGAPLTAEDFVFAHQVYLDPDIPVRDRVPETLMSSVVARDDHTLEIKWKQPYVQANALGYQQLDPLPRHLLEAKFLTNRSSFMFGEEWTSGFIGMGPFRIERWVPGSQIVARANPDWVFGPPKLESVDIRIIPDATTQLANVLSGEVDLVSSPGIRPAEAAVAREQLVPRGEGYVKVWQSQIRFLAFQFREVPDWQRAVSDVRVREAIMHATDRQGLVDVLSSGLGAPADAFLAPVEPAFPEVDRAIRKYAYDPNRALVLLADAGWHAGPAGGPVTNAAGQSLDLDLSSTSGGGGEQEAAIITNSWKAAGINAAISIIPAVRQRDNELRARFPAVSATARTLSPENFVFTSKHVPTPEARWQGANRGSFSDSEVDRLQNVVLTSFDERARHEATIELHKRMSEVLGIGNLYYSAEVLIARSRVKGPIGEYGGQSGMSWNIFEWEVI